MLKLAKAGAAAQTDTALGANEYTRQFRSEFARNGIILYSLTGTFSAQTVTLQVSYDNGANFVTYAAKDVTGAVADVTYTAACNDCVYGPGQLFQFHCSNGGSPDIDILVGGDVVLLDKT
jgi:hypothetical protein